MDLKPLLVRRSEPSEITAAATAARLSNAGSPISGSGKQIKSCSDCHTTRTPLWRGGPAGPKTLCNACGIKYNKKRRETLGLVDKNRIEKAAAKKKSRKIMTTGNGDVSINKEHSVKNLRVMVKERSWKKLMMMSNSKLREEEQAAVLLMALSCGSVYA